MLVHIKYVFVTLQYYSTLLQKRKKACLYVNYVFVTLFHSVSRLRVRATQ